MTDYYLTWITKNIVVGRAPMSYADLDYLKAQGVQGIVNLCGEFSDLHELEEQAGFDVFWLPVADETAPTQPELEKGLEWLDEAVYLGKKVLVHCRHGIGRTGTFITAYLLRRGFGLKRAGKLLKPTRANPSNFSQWWLLRRYGKQEGQLKLAEPTLENHRPNDLSRYYLRYEQLREHLDEHIEKACPQRAGALCCGAEGHHGCREQFSLTMIEALYLNNKINVVLSTAKRQAVIARASVREDGGEPVQENRGAETGCPLRSGDVCLLYDFRPIRCRLHRLHDSAGLEQQTGKELERLSQEIFGALFGLETSVPPPLVSCEQAVSGRFIETCFRFLVSNNPQSIQQQQKK